MSTPGKQVRNGTYEFDYMRVPENKTRWEVIRDGFYNPVEGTYCGHPPKKWGKFVLSFSLYLLFSFFFLFLTEITII